MAQDFPLGAESWLEMQPEACAAWDEQFNEYLYERDSTLAQAMQRYRHGQMPADEQSDFLLLAAVQLEHFLAERLQLQQPIADLRASLLEHDPVLAFKEFEVRKATRRLKALEQGELASFAELHAWLLSEAADSPLFATDAEKVVAMLAATWRSDVELYADKTARLIDWVATAWHSAAAAEYRQSWPSLQWPQRLDYRQLVAAKELAGDQLQRSVSSVDTSTQRDGFALTDQRAPQRYTQLQANYCVYCHKNSGDFCSTGFPVKKNDASLGLKINPLDEILTGCPLDEHISEMNLLRRQGYALAALAVVMINNPLCPLTGHRICNECSKACIYQKQDPVDIPQIETNVLTDILGLPFGVELYALLLRFNPLRQQQFILQPDQNRKVAVMGMGPAGISMAYHLLMQGVQVVGFDGNKIEDLPAGLLTNPIKDYAAFCEDLSERLIIGFGGVAEYGITVRWDKNFLKLIYLCLLRMPHFSVQGGVRFGGQLQIKNAWQYGFDHLVVAVGAGLPRALNIPNSLAPGMQQANAFLMRLQLAGSYQANSLVPLEVDLPAVVIGGGLTAVDTATEVQAYYIVQCERVFQRVNFLSKHAASKSWQDGLSIAEQERLQRWYAHGAAIDAERQRAAKAGEKADLLSLIHSWGGVTLAYRRNMQSSPAYRRNHEELTKALQEGVLYAAGANPTAVTLDEHGWVKNLVCSSWVQDEIGNWLPSDEELNLPARCILVATGAKPNIAYSFEHPGGLARLGDMYETYDLDADGALLDTELQPHLKSANIGIMSSYAEADYRVSIIGDTHPQYHGNVVKALASAKRHYPQVLQALALRPTTDQVATENSIADFKEQIATDFSAQLRASAEWAADIVCWDVYAPAVARVQQPGQIFKLQRFAKNSLWQGDAVPLLALPSPCGADHLRFILNADSLAHVLLLQAAVGEHILCMGPSGVRAKQHSAENIVVIGGWDAACYIMSVGAAWMERANKITWLHLGDQSIDNKVLQLCAKYSDCVAATSSQHLSKLLTDRQWQQATAVYLFAGPAQVAQWRTQLRQLDALAKDAACFVNAYGPMQCMLKGVCAQCLQWQVDPHSGQRTKAVYACSWHVQPAERVDLSHNAQRLQQQILLDKLNLAWWQQQ